MNDFLVRTAVAHSRLHDGDLLRSFVFNTIVSANLSQLPYHAAEARQALPGATGLRPGLLRPVSVNAVSQSLGLPYETTRGRVSALMRLGLCQRTRGGLVAPLDILAGPAFRQTAAVVYAAFLDAVRGMDALGLDLGAAPASAAPDIASRPPPPADLVLRVLMDFQIRVLETFVPTYGDVVRGYVWGGVLQANIRHLLTAHQLAWRYSTQDNPPPDDQRRPVSIRAVAKVLELPYETTRRHVAALAAEGRLKIVPGAGVLAPAEAVGSDGLGRDNPNLMLHFTRMFADLNRIGFDFRAATQSSS
jgi:hypothetical protein